MQLLLLLLYHLPLTILWLLLLLLLHLPDAGRSNWRQHPTPQLG
jgi:hypothetical protein